MKKALFLALALSLLMAGTAMATVVGSAHDLSVTTGPDAQFNTPKVCVFCHAPHNAYVNPGGSTANTYPLWNHQLSSFSDYGIYLSDTMNVTPTSFGGGTASKSALCMSCHDGTIAVNVLYANKTYGMITQGGLDANGHITGGALLGTDLSNDHPVNFTYDSNLASADGGLATPQAGGSYVDAAHIIPLFSGTVQCASCHQVHDSTNRFLRQTQASGTLCITCHSNK